MRLEDPIHKYITAGKAGQMEASETKVVELEEQISSLEVRAKEAEAQVRSQGDEVLRREAAMRHLRDEMQYLRSRAEEEHFHREIMSLQERMSQIGDQQVLIGKVERMKRALGDLQDQRSMKKGSIETEREGIANAQLHLREPQYQDIDAKCRSQQIKQKTTEMATRDLDKYHKALEKALQSYHATKMADINKLIKELWQKTYRNQDIDFIMVPPSPPPQSPRDSVHSPFLCVSRSDSTPLQTQPLACLCPHRPRCARLADQVGCRRAAVVQLPRGHGLPGRRAGHARAVQCRTEGGPPAATTTPLHEQPSRHVVFPVTDCGRWR